MAPDPTPSRAAPLLPTARLALSGAVLGSAALALGMAWVGTVDLVRLAGDFARYAAGGDSAPAARNLASGIADVGTAFLLVAVLVLLGAGLLQAIVRRRPTSTPRLLRIGSVGELVHRVGTLLILLLAVEFARRAIAVPITGFGDVVALAASTALVLIAVLLPGAVARRGGIRRGGDPGEPMPPVVRPAAVPFSHRSRPWPPS